VEEKMLKGERIGEKASEVAFAISRQGESGRTAKIVKIVFLVSLCLTAIGFSFRYLSAYNAQEDKINQLERALNELRSAMNVDTVRQYSIQKVISIIERFNPNMDSAIKYEIANTIYEMSVKYPNLDIDLICATITHESSRSWDPQVRSYAGAMGLMQVMPMTGMYVAQYEGISWTSAEDVLYNPIYNIRIGCRHLSSMISAYNVDGGLAAYNGGERRASLWIKKNRADGILWNETTNYIPSILKLYDEYREMN
jgi:soluble lytic murein transglycosylase